MRQDRVGEALTVIVAMIARAIGAEPAAGQALPPTQRRIAAPEARQGVASDGRFVYAIDNRRIGKYAMTTGRRIASWDGDPKQFRHLNSCTLVGRELVCAASNFPALPQASSVEFFDAADLVHLRTVSLGLGPGSLTAMDRHDNQWWAVFANYSRRGGQPGRDHRSTVLVRMDDNFHQLEAWTFPATIVQRFAPYSVSGASWTSDGRLIVSGHSRPELYYVALPAAGTELVHVSTIAAATRGQAIDWDPIDTTLLWSIDRKRRELVASRPLREMGLAGSQALAAMRGRAPTVEHVSDDPERASAH